MANRLSRRTVLSGAVGSALLVTSPALALAQEPAKEPDPGLDRRLDEVEKKLAHPLDPDVKKLTRKALENLEQEARDRLKTKLPENSEPCFTYIPTEHKSR